MLPRRSLTARCMLADAATGAALCVHWIAATVILTALLAATGCGERSGRLAVSGEVTLDGAPLDSGSIRFTSLNREKLIASGAVIQEGAYFVPEDHGLLPGAYHIEIYSPDDKGPKVLVRQTPGGPALPVPRERIPSEYNAESEKTIEVTAESDNQFDFDIVSAPAT